MSGPVPLRSSTHLRRGAAVYDVLLQVRPVVLGSARAVEADVRSLGWTVGSRAVVEVLTRIGPATVPSIAGELALARQNVQRHVDELAGLGHVRARENPAHRRSVLIELTAPGRTAFSRLHARELKTLSGMAAECSEEDLATAARVLAALDRDIRARTARQVSEEDR